jgi:hypothetical protein
MQRLVAGLAAWPLARRRAAAAAAPAAAAAAFAGPPAARRGLSSAAPDPSLMRNVCIIAHVDHGKTTLFDRLLSACDVQLAGAERAMDSGQLEKERGITIVSKVGRAVGRGDPQAVKHAAAGGAVDVAGA